MQRRRNSIANALEPHLFWIKPLKKHHDAVERPGAFQLNVVRTMQIVLQSVSHKDECKDSVCPNTL